MAGLVYIDAETWRYENAGTADLLKVSGNTLTELPVTKSRTRTAFWQKNRTGIFDIPASKELWIKFDLYYGGSKWCVYDRLNGNDTGIGNYSSNNSITSYINGPLQLEVQPADTIATGSLKTFLLHMVSDATNGLIELWVDGVKLCSEEFADEGLIYSGNVEDGADFENLYLQSDGSTTLYSNVIISNKRIGLGESVIGYSLTQSLVFDAERQLETYGTFIKPLFDTERRLANGIKPVRGITGDSFLKPTPVPENDSVFTIEIEVTGLKAGITYLYKPSNVEVHMFSLWVEDKPYAQRVLYIKSKSISEVQQLGSNISVPDDGKPHKVAVVSYADGSAELYVDGKSAAFSDGMNFKLPTDAVVDFGTITPAVLHELRIWGVARTADVIFVSIRGDEEGLLAWLKPEESGLRDYSVNQRQITAYSMQQTYVATFPPETFDIERRVFGAVHVSASFDVSREVVHYWRHYNLGDAIYLITQGTTLTNLPADKSKTGIAFYNPTQEKCFDIPATIDLWVKFDVYATTLSEPWRAFNNDGNTLFGIRSYDDGALGVFLFNSKTTLLVHGAVEVGRIQTVLMHIRSSNPSAAIEVWIDGANSTSYANKNGSARVWIDGEHSSAHDNSNNTYVTAPFENFYLQSSGEGTFFSNIIISDRQIGFDEGAQRFTCDVECVIQNAANFSADLVREVMAPIIVQQAFDVHCIVLNLPRLKSRGSRD